VPVAVDYRRAGHFGHPSNRRTTLDELDNLDELDECSRTFFIGGNLSKSSTPQTGNLKVRGNEDGNESSIVRGRRR